MWADRIGKDHNPLLSSERHKLRGAAHHHHRRPGGISAPGHHPGECKQAGGSHIRKWPEDHSPTGSGRRDGGRDPRCRNRGDSRRSRPHGPSRIQHHPLERFCRHHQPPHRYGYRTVSGSLLRHHSGISAPGAHRVPEVQGGLYSPGGCAEKAETPNRDGRRVHV